jgi:hypothetical protein
VTPPGLIPCPMMPNMEALSLTSSCLLNSHMEGMNRFLLMDLLATRPQSMPLTLTMSHSRLFQTRIRVGWNPMPNFDLCLVLVSPNPTWVAICLSLIIFQLALFLYSNFHLVPYLRLIDDHLVHTVCDAQLHLNCQGWGNGLQGMIWIMTPREGTTRRGKQH